jgi:VWFA-related protein
MMVSVLRARLSVTLLLTAAATATVASQQAPTGPTPPVTFRAEVNYVEVDASVTDQQGRLVTDLHQTDFEVLEDGRPQKIAAFSLVTLPVEPAPRLTAAAIPIESDVSTNAGVDGRIYLLVLDDLHTTVANTPRVKAFLREFIERSFGPADLAAVAYTSGRIAASQEFTSNRRLLLEAIDRFTGRRLRSEALEIAEALNRDPRDPTDTPVNPRNRSGDGRDPFDPYSGLNPFEAERAYQARTTLTAVRDLASLMQGVHGRRKSMILVSEGLSYNIFDGFRNASAGVILREATDAMAAAMRANVAIYSVDPRGLTTFGEAIDIAGTSPNDPHFTVPGTMLDLLRTSQQSLRELSNQTGGFAGIDSNDLSGVLDRIVRENSTYYLLGYYATNERRDGRLRRIEVRLKRAGLQVRARRGYLAARGRNDDVRAAARPIDGILASPIPVTAIPLTLSAAAYAGAASDASIALAVEMGAGAFRFVEKDDRFLDTVELSISAVDAGGTVRGGRQHKLDLELRAANAVLARERGLRVISEVSLPPGRYQLRVAVAETGAGQTGSVFHDVEIPDFRAAGFWMGGVALTSADASQTPTVRALDPLANVLVSPPTTAREFGRDDVIALLTEFYDNSGVTPHRLELSAVARSDDGRVAFEHRDERSSGGLDSRHRYAVQIPLDTFTPGRYTIRVEGRSLAGGGRSAAREMLIRVR